MSSLFISSLGVMLRKYAFMILAALVLIILVIVLVIRRLVKRHRWKKLKRMIK